MKNLARVVLSIFFLAIAAVLVTTVLSWFRGDSDDENRTQESLPSSQPTPMEMQKQ